VRPTWVTVVGIIALVMGCFGLLGAGQMAMMPRIIQMQKQMFTVMESQAKPEQRAQFEPMRQMVEGLWGELPPWYERFALISGLVTMAIKGFCIYAAISLLQLKRTALPQFYCAVGLSMAAAAVNATALASAFSFMGAGMALGSLAGAVINLVLLLVVLTSDRSIFSRPTPPPLAG
jgi:hypothetical protein